MPTSQPQTPWKPKALLFDLLIGLLDSWTLWNACAGSPAAGLAWRAKYIDITFSCGAYKPYPSLVRQAAAECGAFPSNGDAEKCVSELMRRWGELKAWEEVPGVLEKLREKGYKLGVVTNCSRELGRRAAECVGVGFEVVVTAEESAYYKPHPQAYAADIEALGCEPEEILFVAGSSGDVVGAAEGGKMRVVWNNHAGLAPKVGRSPLKEGKSLDEALSEFI